MASPIALVPENFCIKYDPPTFGILYHLTSDSTLKFLHHIKLNLEKSTDPKDISRHLFKSEKVYLNPTYVKEEQVESLIQKIISHYSQDDIQEAPQPTEEPDKATQGDKETP